MWHRIDDPDNPPPKDGTAILVAWKAHAGKHPWFIQPVEWRNGLWVHSWDSEDIYGPPTHWMPLPPPPAEETP